MVCAKWHKDREISPVAEGHLAVKGKVFFSQLALDVLGKMLTLALFLYTRCVVSFSDDGSVNFNVIG